MSKEKKSLDLVEAEVKLTPDHRKKIAQILSDNPNRFLDTRDFVSRALDVFLTWEKDPFNSMAKMSEMEPTMKQFQFMKIALNPEKLKEMHPDFPEKWGKEWEEFLIKNPIQMPQSEQSQKQHEARKSKEDFEKIQANIMDANNYLREIKFEGIVDDKLEQIHYDKWPLISTIPSNFISLR